MILEHVAAQIDALYWNQTNAAAVVAANGDGDVERVEGAVPLDADLRSDRYVTLPSHALQTVFHVAFSSRL